MPTTTWQGPVRRQDHRIAAAGIDFPGRRQHHHRQRRLLWSDAGEAYINGTAGERFCVRNSGIDAVVEGVGNHGCEYMTGGRVLILGQTGHNFAAGMSGGVAYIYDLDPQKCNTDLVKLEPLTDEAEKASVKTMLKNHVRFTDSNLGHILLENWDDTVNHLTKVIPEAYEEMVSLIEKAKADGHSDERSPYDCLRKETRQER